MQKDAYRPTLGSTPAIIENAMASGIKARATSVPDSKSLLTLVNQFFLKYKINKAKIVSS